MELYLNVRAPTGRVLECLMNAGTLTRILGNRFSITQMPDGRYSVCPRGRHPGWMGALALIRDPDGAAISARFEVSVDDSDIVAEARVVCRDEGGETSLRIEAQAHADWEAIDLEGIASSPAGRLAMGAIEGALEAEARTPPDKPARHGRLRSAVRALRHRPWESP